MIDNGSAASEQVTGLIQDNRADIAVLLGNLLTVSEMTAVRLDAVEQLLVVYPAVSMGGYVVPAKDPGTGHYDAHFGLVLGLQPARLPGRVQRHRQAGPAGHHEQGRQHQGRLYREPVDRASTSAARRTSRPRRPARTLNRIGYGVGYDPATGAAGGSGGMPELVLGSTGGQEDLLGSGLLESPHPRTGDRQVTSNRPGGAR